jgi:two-component sensor histidine kinase
VDDGGSELAASSASARRRSAAPPLPGANHLLAEISGRVSAISEMYSLLYSSGSSTEVDLGDYLDKISGLLAGNAGILLRKDFARGIVAAEAAIAIGLIVTELLTNAIKYAFPGESGGTLSLSTVFDGEGRTWNGLRSSVHWALRCLSLSNRTAKRSMSPRTTYW